MHKLLLTTALSLDLASAELLKRGCRVATGLDGLAFDEDEDASREMRLGYALHKARGFERPMGREDLLRFATETGRFAVTGETDGGRLGRGAPADILVLDWDALSADLVEPDVPAFDLLLASRRREHVCDLYVARRKIVANGEVAGVDLPALEAELLATLRRERGQTSDIRAIMPELKSAIGRHYDQPFYCG